MDPVSTLLTPDNLNAAAASGATQQGQTYYSNGQARVTGNSGARIDAQVNDPAIKETYNVNILNGSFGLEWHCTCNTNGSVSGGEKMCAHAYASALAAQH